MRLFGLEDPHRLVLLNGAPPVGRNINKNIPLPDLLPQKTLARDRSGGNLCRHLPGWRKRNYFARQSYTIFLYLFGSWCETVLWKASMNSKASKEFRRAALSRWISHWMVDLTAIWQLTLKSTILQHDLSGTVVHPVSPHDDWDSRVGFYAAAAAGAVPIYASMTTYWRRCRPSVLPRRWFIVMSLEDSAQFYVAVLGSEFPPSDFVASYSCDL